MAGASTAVFTSLIVWLEASMFIKVYELHSLTSVAKLVRASWCGKTTKVINMLYTIDCSNIRKRDANIQRDIDNKLISLTFSTILRLKSLTNLAPGI